MSGKQGESAAAKVIMAVFLFAMGCAAAWIGLRHAQSISLAWSARSWMEVDAVLIHWDLGVSKKGYSTSEVVAEYQWSHGGKTYGSKRVAVVGLRDGFSSRIKSEAKSKFIDASRKDGAMKVWMDPLDPSQAVAVRTVPVSWAAFASFFLMVPCGISTAFALGAMSKGVDKVLKRSWLAHRWGGLWLVAHASWRGRAPRVGSGGLGRVGFVERAGFGWGGHGVSIGSLVLRMGHVEGRRASQWVQAMRGHVRMLIWRSR